VAGSERNGKKAGELMRVKVVCNNCGIKWVRIVPTSHETECTYLWDIQYNCSNCGSNDYELQKIEQKETKDGKFV